jgi:hypothetical protein
MNEPHSPRRRVVATAFLILFAVGGVWFFRGRLVHDVTLRLELPTFVLGPSGERVARGAFGRLLGQVRSGSGEVTSTFEARASDGPVASPVALRLQDGLHAVEVRLPEAHAGLVLSGRFEVSGGGEVSVDLRVAR